MALTPSTMLALGSKAPDFRLPDVDGTMVGLADFQAAPALLVMFICNHCPYVKHVRHELAKLGRDYVARGAAVVAINANDAVAPDIASSADPRGLVKARTVDLVQAGTVKMSDARADAMAAGECLKDLR